MTNEHPSKKTLFDFAQGKLAPDSLEQVAEHIENCPTCVDFLEQSINDTLVDQLREAAIGNASNLFEESFEVHQTVQFSQPQTPVDLEGMLREHPKYKLLDSIGSGGMGAVFKARHEIMDREVAIKVIRPELVANKEAVARFHNEVRAAAKLSHRNIVAAYDAEQVGNAHFLIMEYVVGESLAETVARRGKLPVTHACNYAVQIAQGLKHAHENGMIHRDIKPQNLMKTPKGIIKILDFGLARIGDTDQDDAQLTSTGVMMGTADYIAPEQARNAREADIRSDLYSLGCTFYFLLVGQAPFKTAANRVDKILAHCTKAFPDPSGSRSDIPEGVWPILQKLTAKSPAERFQTPSQLIDALAPFAKPARQESNTIMESTPRHPAETVLPPRSADKDTHFQSAGHQTAAPPIPAPVSKDVAAENFSINSDHSPESYRRPVSSRSDQNKIPLFLRRGFLGLGAGIALLIALAVMLPKWMDGSGKKNESKQTPNQTNAAGSSADSGKMVVALFAYQRFCFGDFGPFRDELQARGIQVHTASDTKRLISFVDFAEDQTPNKHNVQADYSISELKQLVDAGKIDALVIMGGDSPIQALADSSTSAGQEFADIFSQMKSQKKWLGAIGKGINLPYRLGYFDGLPIADPENWLDVPRRSQVKHSSRRVEVMNSEKLVTAKEWHDSADLGKRLAEELNLE